MASTFKSAWNNIAGNDGSTADKAPSAAGYVQTLNNNVMGVNSPQMQDILSKYSSGQMSLSDALNAAATTTPGSSPTNANMQAADELFTNPETAALAAQSQVMSNPVYSGLFGQNGLEGKAEGQYDTASGNLAQDRNALMGNDQSYGLTTNDLMAYGQASDNITRQYANSGNQLAQSLADRGLASAPSGVAGQQFSTLAGNQNEQLAQAQQQIAQNRIQTAQQLAQARTNADLQQQSQNGNLAAGLGNLGMNATNSQQANNMQGAQEDYNQLAGSAGMAMQNQGLQQNVNNSLFSQQQQTQNPGLFGAFTSGLQSGVSSLGNYAGSLGTSKSTQSPGGSGAASSGLAAMI